MRCKISKHSKGKTCMKARDEQREFYGQVQGPLPAQPRMGLAQAVIQRLMRTWCAARITQDSDNGFLNPHDIALGWCVRACHLRLCSWRHLHVNIFFHDRTCVPKSVLYDYTCVPQLSSWPHLRLGRWPVCDTRTCDLSYQGLSFFLAGCQLLDIRALSSRWYGMGNLLSDTHF